jgi:hypothetical protein
MSGTDITAAFREGKHIEVLRALVRAAQDFAEQHGANVFAEFPEMVQQMTGMEASTVAAFAKMPLTRVSDQALKTARESRAAHDAWEHQMRSVERQWNRLKNRFVTMIAKIGKPLGDLIEDQLGPLEEIMDTIADAATKAMKAFTADPGTGGFFERIKDAANIFWREMGDDAQIKKFLASFQKVMKASADWFAENFFAPVIQKSFEQILTPALYRTIFKDVEVVPYSRSADDIRALNETIRAMIKPSLYLDPAAPAGTELEKMLTIFSGVLTKAWKESRGNEAEFTRYLQETARIPGYLKQFADNVGDDQEIHRLYLAVQGAQ